jgi:cytochrome b561
MQLTNSSTRYGAIPQIMHWLTVVFVIVAWLLGWFLGYFPKEARSAVLLIHMTLGQCVLALFLVRLTWRIVNPPPPMEKTRFGRLQEKSATIIHYALYALLLAVPFAGIAVDLKRGDPLPIFGLWNAPSPWPVNREAAHTVLKVHEYLANTLVTLAGLHASAALMHHWIFGDRTLRRMLPGASMIDEPAL